MPLTGHFVGIGVPPQVVSAIAPSRTSVRVLFSEAMAALGLTTPGNYTLTPSGGAAARAVTSVSPDQPTDPTSVTLGLDGPLTIGSNNYTVAVNVAVTDAAGNGMDPAHRTAVFGGPTGHATPDIPDHCAVALDRLSSQFRLPDLEAFVCVLADRATELEQALTDVRAYRSIATGQGAQLDAIGTILDQPREGLLDETYRVRLRARAHIIGSRGRTNELLDVLTTLDNGFAPSQVTVAEHFPESNVFHCLVASGQELVGEAFARMLKRGKAAGSRLILLFEEQGATLFAWALSADDPAPAANSGWAEEGTPAVGGRFAEGV